MCGIAGWYRRGAGAVPLPVVRAACDAIRHRGPDDHGLHVDGDVGFGMRRLSILDIAGGHQPMTSPDDRFTIVFNGEIYNHLDVRAELAAEGYAFATRSDTETVLLAFAAWRDDAWARLEGMFAVAIWDRASRSLTLARDPLGIKPLYVTEQDGGLAFASELKSLRALPGLRFDVDARAVDDFFTFGHVRRPRSIFRQVESLEPGSSLTLAATGDARRRTYWRPRTTRGPDLDDGAWVEQMRALLLGSTARHMQSDEPVGAFLSGGVDSSAVLAAMRRVSAAPIKAFTIGYPGAAIDETAAARETAAHLGCEHVVLPLAPADSIAALPDVLRCYDEPFADPAAIPTWFASRLAAEHVKVVLCGEGGDELFAGYKRHRNARAVERHRPLLAALRPLLRAAGSLPATPSARLNYLARHGRRLADYAGRPDGFPQFIAATGIAVEDARRQVYTRDFARDTAPDGRFARRDGRDIMGDAADEGSALEQFLLAELTLNLPSAMLTRLDRASMAHSLEARVPLLSHKLVDWALTVPERLKLDGGQGKIILREAARPWLPPSFARRPKQGFQIPHAAWLRGAFGAHAQSLWHDSGAASAGYLDPAAVDALFAAHRRGAADHGRLLYAIAAFAFWWREAR